jgi:hypothetical protein
MYRRAIGWTRADGIPLQAENSYRSPRDTVVTIGKLTAVRKAAKFGYRKYGLPGAIAAGVSVLVGYRFVRRKLGSRGGRE